MPSARLLLLAAVAVFASCVGPEPGAREHGNGGPTGQAPSAAPPQAATPPPGGPTTTPPRQRPALAPPTPAVALPATPARFRNTCLDQQQGKQDASVTFTHQPVDAGPPGTLIAIDGDGADWQDRTPLTPDAAGDAEPGTLDFTAGYAFMNEHALYVLVETANPEVDVPYLELDLRVDARLVRIQWGVGDEQPWIADMTVDWVDIGEAVSSRVAFKSAYEARLDFRDIGRPQTVTVVGLGVRAGTCCDETWRFSDEWRPKEPAPKVDERDPDWRLTKPLGASEASLMLAAPDTRHVTLDFDAAAERVRVVGAAGAVPPSAAVLVGNLELNDYATRSADIHGAFEAEVAAFPGTHVLIRQDTTGRIIRPEGDRHRFDEDMIAPGVLLRIPMSNADGAVAFSAGARGCCGESPITWTVAGRYDRREAQPGETLAVSGEVSVWAEASAAPPVTPLEFTANLAGDEHGRQVGRAGKFVSVVLTATGLPIERDLGGGPVGKIHVGGTDALRWAFRDGRWRAAFQAELSLPAGLRHGLYELAAGGMWNLGEAALKPLPSLRPFQVTVRDSQAHWAHVGMLRVGKPERMRLATVLLADEVSEGSRGGVIARQDDGAFDVSIRTLTRHDPIVPRLDPYGEAWTYQLEPYAPMLDVVDRALPNPPAIALDFAGSSLTVEVTRPDGAVHVLGPAPLTRYAVKSPRTPWGDAMGRGGGELRDIPQLLGDPGVFAYRFPVDGDYVVKLSGHVRGVDGETYDICGTYDVLVANFLDVEAGFLPTTPFEVGDAIPPVLTVMPGGSADVTFAVTYAAADGTTAVERFAGKANRHGWWDGGGDTYTFDAPGEYRVDAEARYVDDAGNLWAGRLRFGSVVATPDAPIVAHGRRGPDNQVEMAPPWAFEHAFVMAESDHMQFPYFTGDILWGVRQSDAGDAVVTHLSVQPVDESNGLVRRALAQSRRADSFGGPPLGDQIRAGQVPLVLAPEPYREALYGSAGAHPDDLPFRTYIYGSAQRPGVRVRELIQGDDVNGAYWRFGDAYNGQSGNGREGDEPDDVKFLYGAAVIHDVRAGAGVYAIYGSAWVHARDDDPLGSRFMPPFRGAAGGPDGGPLLTAHGRDVDLFFMPMAVRPGALLEVGDTFRMAGPVMPTLPSLMEYTVTAPDGSTRALGGRANAVGYFYDPADDFTLDQPGLWTVTVRVTHDGQTSAGPVSAPFPTGGVLSPDGETFSFVVTGADTHELTIETDLTDLRPDEWYRWGHVRNATFEATLPDGWQGDAAHIVVTMPGNVLVDEPIAVENGVVRWKLHGEALHAVAQNFDVESGLADTVTVTVSASAALGGQPSLAAGTIVAQGARVAGAPSSAH